MATAVVGAVSFPASISTATATVERHGLQFTSVVDLVEDYGADPTGQEPVDEAIKQAVSADTLVEVPDGEYLFSGEVLISPPGNVGFVAKDGANPRFVAPDGFNDWLLNVYHLPGALFENIDIDITSENTTAGLRFDVEDQVHVENVEYLGRGTHSDSSVINALEVGVTNGDGTGMVRNVTAKKGSAIGHYKGGDGREAIFIGDYNYGTVRIEDCHFEEFGNNALYCSRTPGSVEVVGGTYRNNNVSSVRIGGATSYVEGATIEVDLDTYTGPTTRMDSSYNTRGVWLEQRTITKTSGATVRDCDIHIKNADRSDGAVKIWGLSGESSSNIRNTRIKIDEDDVWAVSSDNSQVVLDGVSLTGTAASGEAVFVRGVEASASVVQNSCIEQTGSTRDGVRVKDALDCSVVDSNINVTGEEVTANTVVEVLNLTTDGTCPLPSFVADPLPNTISLEGGSEDEWVTYEFTVSDELAKATGTEGADDNDTVSGSTASGQVAGGVDTFTFSGVITRFDHDGPLTVTLNGETFPASKWKNLPEQLVIEGEDVDTLSTYDFEVSDEVVHDPTVGTVNPEYGDDIDGTNAVGEVRAGTDAYRFSGEITRFDHDGPLVLTLDEKTFPASEWMNLPNAITFVGKTTSKTATYAFDVSDEVVKDPTVGSLEGDESISGTAVEGQVTGDTDGYRYAGEVKSLTTKGPVDVTLEDAD